MVGAEAGRRRDGGRGPRGPAAPRARGQTTRWRRAQPRGRPTRRRRVSRPCRPSPASSPRTRPCGGRRQASRLEARPRPASRPPPWASRRTPRRACWVRSSGLCVLQCSWAPGSSGIPRMMRTGAAPERCRTRTWVVRTEDGSMQTRHVQYVIPRKGFPVTSSMLDCGTGSVSASGRGIGDAPIVSAGTGGTEDPVTPALLRRWGTAALLRGDRRRPRSRRPPPPPRRGAGSRPGSR